MTKSFTVYLLKNPKLDNSNSALLRLWLCRSTSTAYYRSVIFTWIENRFMSGLFSNLNLNQANVPTKRVNRKDVLENSLAWKQSFCQGNSSSVQFKWTYQDLDCKGSVPFCNVRKVRSIRADNKYLLWPSAFVSKISFQGWKVQSYWKGG